MYVNQIKALSLYHNNKKTNIMTTTIKLYRVSAAASVREVNARSKKEAVEIFKKQVKGLISESGRILYGCVD